MITEEIKRNYLEIKSLNELSKVEKPNHSSKVVLIDPPDFQLNKFFYKQIGKKHQWVDRLAWNEKDWINFPDYQARIYKNVHYIKWIRPVHERIDGHKSFSHLPPKEELSFYHHKEIDKQEKQNEFYGTIK